jgi:preprotein translocase subunit SecD
MGEKKRVNLAFLILVLFLVGLSIWWLFFRQPIQDAIQLGLDLQSGTQLLLALEPNVKWSGTSDDLKTDLNAAQSTLSEMQKKKVSPDILNPLEKAWASLENQGELSQVDFENLQSAVKKLGFVAEAQPWQDILSKLKPAALTPADVSRVKDVLERRINEFGTKEPIIQTFGENHIIVDLPAVTDPREAEKIVTKQAYLEFKELTPAGKAYFESHNAPPEYYDPLMWKTFMNGSALADAEEEPAGGSQGGGNTYVVAFTLTPEGKKIFGDVTSKNVGRPIAIYLDGIFISAPIVNEPITGGRGQIEGSFTLQEAHQLAVFLKAGALPIPIKIEESVTVGPTLGHEALVESLQAGFLGLGLVILFMLIFYRLPGFISALALIIYALWLLAIMSSFGFVLTLPGIAGVVLSIGMAVDANILIFERVKEELWAGKSIPTAVDIGFHRAWSSILDSHMTTIVGAAALIWKGSSSIQGFGMALLIGTVLSLITAWGVTRIFMDWTVLNNVTSSRTAYGA